MVECVKCQCSTPLFDCNHDAAAIWNSRDASALQDARRAALEFTIKLCDTSISYFKDGAAETARVPKNERDGIVIALDDLRNAIARSLPSPSPGGKT